jgi:glycosyltransferase involved in cell wall biosynthesis
MRVAIIHPWFPQYRAAFFDKIVEQCASQNIDLKIFHGDSPPEWTARDDSLSSERFIRLRTHFFSVGGRTLNYKSLEPFGKHGPFDLVILEQAVRNIETYRLLMSHSPLAFWGHGKTYTIKVNSAQEQIKQWLTRRGRWFFAYTTGGVDAVVRAGFRKSRTTVVQNSIDTTSLQSLIASVSQRDLANFIADHDLQGKTALFIGGLDASKRIPFLIASSKIAHELDPDFRLLIAGAGVEQHLVASAADAHSYITYLGPLFEKDKALAMTAADVIAMPGRVGLVAVDSFAARTPVVTTDWAWHAPEFEYLESNANAIVTADNVEAFANGLVRILQNKPNLARLQAACGVASDKYTVQAMADNFVSGIVQALAVNR